MSRIKLLSIGAMAVGFGINAATVIAADQGIELVILENGNLKKITGVEAVFDESCPGFPTVQANVVEGVAPDAEGPGSIQVCTATLKTIDGSELAFTAYVLGKVDPEINQIVFRGESIKPIDFARRLGPSNYFSDPEYESCEGDLPLTVESNGKWWSLVKAQTPPEAPWYGDSYLKACSAVFMGGGEEQEINIYILKRSTAE